MYLCIALCTVIYICKLMKKFFLIIFCFFGIGFISAHPVHVSITTIEYQPEKKGFVVAIKIFYDDISISVLNRYKETLNFVTSKKESEKSSHRYISEVFAIKINNKEQSGRMKFAFSEIHSEALWMYYVLPYKESIKNVTVTNSILNEMYPDQKNLVIVKIDKFEKGYSLDRNNNECKIEL